MISQEMILNKILQTKDLSIIKLNNLTEDYFFNYKAEFNFILNHYDKYKVVPDITTFLYTFPNFEQIQVSEPDNYLLEQLYNDYNASYLASSFNKIRVFLQNGDVEKAKDLYTSGYNNLHTGSVMTCTDILKDTSRYDRYLSRTSDQHKFYISTGFKELDKLVGGIDRENENLVIIARTGQGKTQLLLKMAAEASKQGLTVGIYEGEMTTDKVAYRLDTFLGHLSNTSLNRGDLFIQQDYKHYIDSLSAVNYGAIKVFTPNDVPTGRVTVDTLRTFIEKEKLDILFIDQYDLLDDLSRTKVYYEKIANIARDIKKLQVEKQIPIISVSQMNRTKNENGTQDTTQVAGSDMIPRYATIMIALEQGKYDEETRRVDLTFNIIKARDGGDNNKLLYAVNFNTGDFKYIPNEKDTITSEEDLQELANSYGGTGEAIY